MMKTPDEIKKALECCFNAAQCRDCPYYPTTCDRELVRDAREYIQQLEAERDAAVDGLKSNCTCPECKYFSDDIQDPCRGCKPTASKFEWRGVQKEESEDGKE